MRYILLFAMVLTSQIALACATCSGPADAPQSQGMNAAILTLFCVLGGVAVVFLGFAGAIALRIARHNAHQTEQRTVALPQLADSES